MNTKPRPFYVIIKALCLFLLINVMYALVNPPIANVSIYNRLVPGLERMPFGNGNDPYTITVDNADAMFAAHKISSHKASNEIRVALVGDSSIWGDALSSHTTLAAQWDQLGAQCGGKQIKVYNLGYPHPSIIKDLIFIDELKARQPDVIIWFITLNTLINQDRLNPFLTGNREQTLRMLDTYAIPFAPRKTLAETNAGLYEKTLVGQSSFLARWIKLQALGLVWSATGDDVHHELGYSESMAGPDVSKDISYRGLQPGDDLHGALLLKALDAGHAVAGKIPLVLVNEPIYIATGLHSDVRYNDLYPRWAYDQYRDIIAAQAHSNSWAYLDMWNVIPPKYFIDASLHIQPKGEKLFAEQLNPALLSMVCP